MNDNFAEYIIGEDEKDGEIIDYTKYLEENDEVETDPVRIKRMTVRLAKELSDRKVCRHADHTDAVYYKSGVALVRVNGKYYNCFDTVRGKWFSGYVGDCKNG